MWLNNLDAALKVLDEHYTIDEHFIIRKRDDDHVPTEKERNAIDFLFQECEYSCILASPL